MQLNKIEDPRDQLQRARRPELFAWAQANKVAEIPTEDMDAETMRKILRSKGLSRIPLPRRPLGMISDRQVIQTKHLHTMPAAPKPRPVVVAAPEEKPVAKMGINELRDECKRRSIKMDRRDNTESLKVKVQAARDGS